VSLREEGCGAAGAVAGTGAASRPTGNNRRPRSFDAIRHRNRALAERCTFRESRGFDRDRAFYPTVLIVIALYYVLFAAMSESAQTVLLESVVMVGFSIAAVVGFKSSAWMVVGGLAGHGVFDALHSYVLENSGVPMWWPAFCLAFDLAAAGGLAWVIKRRPGGYGVPSRST
jgi:hypothetical protein